MRDLASLVREAAALLYGEQWQNALARDLGVGPRTVQRWASGESTPPPGVRAEIAALVGARRIALERMHVELLEAGA